MALSAPEPPTGLSAVPWLLFEDERGSAAVEFIVLIPVYVILLIGLFSLSQMSIARQQVVQAARLIVWSPGSRFADQDVKTHLFGAHDGTFTVTPQGGDNTLVKFQPVELRPGSVDLGDGNYSEGTGNPQIEQIATNLLNNDLPVGPDVPPGGPTGAAATQVYGNGQSALRRRKVIVSFQNTGLVFGINPTSSCSAEVLVWNHAHQRGEANGDTSTSFSQFHWVGHRKVRNAVGREDPGLIRNRYLSPERGTFSGQNPTPPPLNVYGSTTVQKTPGLWDPLARIRGSITAERAYYKSRGP